MLVQYLHGEYSKTEKILAVIIYKFAPVKFSAFTSGEITQILNDNGLKMRSGDVSSRLSRIMRSDLGMFFRMQDSDSRAFVYHVDERLAELDMATAYEVFQNRSNTMTGADLAELNESIKPLWEVFQEIRPERGKKKKAKDPVQTPVSTKEMPKNLLPGQIELESNENVLLYLVEILRLHDIRTRVSGHLTIHFGDETTALRLPSDGGDDR